MFNTEDIKEFVTLINEKNLIEDKMKKINKKIKKYDELYLTLTDYNELLYALKINEYYSIIEFRDFLRNNNLSYAWLRKNTGIPKATLSKILNNGRNIKLSTLNNILTIINTKSQIIVSKDDFKIRKGE